jgi:hypothetical protein
MNGGGYTSASGGGDGGAGASGGGTSGGGAGGARSSGGSGNSGGNVRGRRAESVQMVGGLISVVVGVAAVTALATVTILVVNSGNSNTIIPLSTAAFGVISAIVGAYLGIKIGTDQSKELVGNLGESQEKLAEAVHKLGS